MRLDLPGAAVTAILVCAPCATAQDVPDSRVAVTVSAGYGVTARTFSQTTTFELFSEDGSLTSAYTVKQAPLVEGAATYRLWHNLGVGAAASSVRQSGPARLDGRIPDPFTFNLLHPISGAPTALHTETAVHAQAAYWLQAGRVDVIVSGGPSFFRSEQDFVSDVTYTNPPPYNAPAYQAATLTRARRTVTGGNVGAEAGWRIAPHLGVAAVVRYSRATADFTAAGGTSVALGGLHVGGGIRFLF